MERKTDGSELSEHVHVRLTRRERAALDAKAAGAGVGVSEIVRAAIAAILAPASEGTIKRRGARS